MGYDFGRKSREPFRNVPENGMELCPMREPLRSLNHTRKDGQVITKQKQLDSPKHCYSWKRWFPNLKQGDTVLIHIRDHHDICRMHKEFREHKTQAEIWNIDHDRRLITLTVEKDIGTIKVKVHIQVVFDPSSPAFVSHNGVNITGKINKEKDAKKWESKQSK